jgi:MoxR-like ATPase
MEKRGHVLPEDVQAVLPGVVGHRLAFAGDAGRVNGADVADALIRQVPIP